MPRVVLRQADGHAPLLPEQHGPRHRARHVRSELGDRTQQVDRPLLRQAARRLHQPLAKGLLRPGAPADEGADRFRYDPEAGAVDAPLCNGARVTRANSGSSTSATGTSGTGAETQPAYNRILLGSVPRACI